MKFRIRIDLLFSPFMLFIGATRENSYVELTGDAIRLRFGPTFDHTIARDNVIGAAPMSWSLFDGFGVRAGGQIVGVIGSTSGVVELRLRQPATFRYAMWPWTVSRVAISLEDPRGFIEQLQSTSPSA